MNGPRKTLLLLRIVAFVHALLVIGQPVFAGFYLSGDVDAMALHSIIGSGLAAVTMLLGAAAILYWRPGRGPFWPVLAVAALFLIEGLQIGMGYTRAMSLHVPLGVAIVTLTVLFTGWLFTPAARRPRSGPAKAAADARADAGATA